MQRKKFSFRVSREFASRIIANDEHDPLLLQVLPQEAEKFKVKGFVANPLCEEKFEPVPGLLHKYFGRVLLLVTDQCPLHCRFCFRRYTATKIQDWPKVFQYLTNDKTITEVILSGGEPLMLSESELQKIISKLVAILHIKRLRIHTRLPIALPSLITAALVKVLTSSRLPVVIVMHCNHPNEIDEKVAAAVRCLRDAGIMVLNQSVLLKGVNDSAAVLCALSEKLFAIGVLPYYLHLLDKVKGAAHFFVSPKRALQLLREVAESLPGYLVPKLVYEKPGARAKVNV
jgi:L-lysine 2,3-aminomutase